MAESQEQIDINRRWLSAMREHLGWSTTETAEHARRAAESCHEQLKLSQQALSAFENGKHKSTPRWLGYVLLAMRHHMATRRMDDSALGDLCLPSSMAAFFESKQANGYGLEAVQSDEPVSDFTGELHIAYRGPPTEVKNPDTVELAEFDVSYGFGGGFIHETPGRMKMRTFSRAWVRQFTDSPFDHLFWATGNGTSMMPAILENDILLIDTDQRTPRMADQFWALDMHGMGSIKALRPAKDSGMQIISINPDWPNEVAYDGEMNVVGRVVAIVRKV